MASSFARIVVAALGVSVALFLFHLFLVPTPGSSETGFDLQDRTSAFESSRKNYASVKVSASGLPIGDSQKYEKIASVTQLSESFDADRRLIEGRIAESAALLNLNALRDLAASELYISESACRPTTSMPSSLPFVPSAARRISR
jgi:hypothetical protein